MHHLKRFCTFLRSPAVHIRPEAARGITGQTANKIYYKFSAFVDFKKNNLYLKLLLQTKQPGA